MLYTHAYLHLSRHGNLNEQEKTDNLNPKHSRVSVPKPEDRPAENSGEIPPHRIQPKCVPGTGFSSQKT